MADEQRNEETIASSDALARARQLADEAASSDALARARQLADEAYNYRAGANISGNPIVGLGIPLNLPGKSYVLTNIHRLAQADSEEKLVDLNREINKLRG